MSEKQDDRDESGSRGSRVVGHIAKWTLIIIAFALVLGILVQLLWNWLMPALFGLGKINTVQGIGLILLSRILFGRMGQRREHAGYLTGKYGFRSPAWLGRGAREDTAKDTIDA
ncbi:MAG: hypothetical protein WA946_04435 [Nitrospirota bacterium]